MFRLPPPWLVSACLARPLALALCLAWLAPGAWASDWIAPLSDGARIGPARLNADIPLPSAVLKAPLGERFTRHDRLLRYLEKLAEASPRVTLHQYGESYEGRPLVLLAISDPANIDRLEELRRHHLERLTSSKPVDDDPAIVWLGYGVHGNESSSAEAALGVAYLLAAVEEESWRQRLRQVVVLIDPLLNPDGRARYVHGYQQRRGRVADPWADSYEHSEPWPGGRQNHYLFDLNRDWAWATQRETQARLALFRSWEPQVHVDFHEMRSGSTYFFPPAADPIHPAISPRVVDWLETFGRGNAAAFDAHGWPFYKGQLFDLFYPAYGDSYPSLGGAVGMTYEMAGGGRAGTVIERVDGTRLTLVDRVARHITTSLATVETTAENRRELLRDFRAFRRASARANGQSFLWSAEQAEAGALAELLVSHGIEVHRLAADTQIAVRSLAGESRGRRQFAADSWLVSTAQPLGKLAQSLLEGEADLGAEFLKRQRQRLADEQSAQFYDITAWSLPLAFNLEMWLAPGRPEGLIPYLPEEVSDNDETTLDGATIEGAGRVGFLMAPQGLAGYRFAAALRRAGIHHRLALGSFSLGGRELPSGTIFIPRRENPKQLETRLGELARQCRVVLSGAETSYSESGISLGSEEMVRVQPSAIGLVVGPGVSPTAAGALWHLFDQVIELSHHRVELDDLTDRLSGLGVLLMPSGFGYSSRLGEEDVAAIERWVRAGGTLIAIKGALEWLREAELVELEEWQAEGDESLDEGAATEGTAGSSMAATLDLSQRKISIPGAVVRTRLRTVHPLTAGLASAPPSLFGGSQFFLPGDAAGNLLWVEPRDPVLAGHVWEEALERLAGAVLVREERLGSGRIVLFAQDPAFRGLWRGTMPLLLNAVMFAPSLP